MCIVGITDCCDTHRGENVALVKGLKTLLAPDIIATAVAGSNPAFSGREPGDNLAKMETIVDLHQEECTI